MQYFAVLILSIFVSLMLFGRRNRSPSSEALKKRVEDLRNFSETAFYASPGDPRLKPGWEYLVALKKPGEDSFTATFFSSAGINHTQSGLSEQDIFGLEKEGWHINGQRYNSDGMSWQLERLTAPH